MEVIVTKLEGRVTADMLREEFSGKWFTLRRAAAVLSGDILPHIAHESFNRYYRQPKQRQRPVTTARGSHKRIESGSQKALVSGVRVMISRILYGMRRRGSVEERQRKGETEFRIRPKKSKK